MSRAVASAGLLSDPGFLADLDKLDIFAQAEVLDETGLAPPEVGRCRTDTGTGNRSRADAALGAPSVAARQVPRQPMFMMPETAPSLTDLLTDPAIRRSLIAVAGFVLMMSIGAGAAAVVFHERVAQIVAMYR